LLKVIALLVVPATAGAVIVHDPDVLPSSVITPLFIPAEPRTILDAPVNVPVIAKIAWLVVIELLKTTGLVAVPATAGAVIVALPLVLPVNDRMPLDVPAKPTVNVAEAVAHVNCVSVNGAVPAPPPMTNPVEASTAEDAHVVALLKYGIPPDVPATVSAGVVVGVATEIKPPVNETLVTVPEPAGKSAATNARKVGISAAPVVGPAHTVFAGSVAIVKVNAGVVVGVATADVIMEPIFPALKDVTVPVGAAPLDAAVTKP
jgi:hypothetical protein